MFKLSLKLVKHFAEKSKIKTIRSKYSTKNCETSTCIYALASGANQRCGVAVVRLSGRNALNIMLEMIKNKTRKILDERKMYFRDIFNPFTNEKIDKGLVVWFKGLLNNFHF